MSGPLRRRMMATLVIAVALWPVAHAGLVAVYRTDAWELFGWSMYALPAARVQVRVEVERDGESRPLRAMGRQRERVLAFARRRTALGELAPTARLARQIFEEDATLEALTIFTREISLDPRTARLVARDERHRHRRPDVGSDARDRYAPPDPDG